MTYLTGLEIEVVYVDQTYRPISSPSINYGLKSKTYHLTPNTILRTQWYMQQINVINPSNVIFLAFRPIEGIRDITLSSGSVFFELSLYVDEIVDRPTESVVARQDPRILDF